jgi:chromosome segregation ATPase
MEWQKSKATIIVICGLALLGLQGYALMSMRSTMDERMSSMEGDYADADEKLTMLMSDLNVVTKKMGVTEQELEQALTVTKQLKQENTQLARRLRGELARKADSKTVAKFQQEATTKLDAVHQETTTKIDGITGEVRVVRTDLDATRNDLKLTRSDLTAAREEMVTNKRDLGTLIARNSTELSELRRKGERDYVEFDITKGKTYNRVGDVLVQLKKTDVKRQKYEVVINADDSAIQKKDRTANEPVTFLVGRDRVRYELVVNYVDKDRIRGYVSAPRDKMVNAETPSLRVQ